jgi:iron complex outermembrane receptor protein
MPAACCFLLFWPAPGAAEEADAAQTSDAAVPRQGLEEITVSAERREQDLQKVPAAISAFSGDDIDSRGLTNFNQLQYSVPSLFSGSGLTKITLRGVGSEIVGPGVDPGFAVHVNGVYSARETTGLLDFFDIESVDVLRGPQGMLWGRNSTGGAVNIVTARPRPGIDGYADVEHGSFDNTLVRSAVNVPLVEGKLYSRLAMLGRWSEGFMEIDGPGNRQNLNDNDTITLRGSLRWEPAESFTVDLIGSYFYVDNDGPGIKFFGEYETPALPAMGIGFGGGLDYSGALPNPGDPYKGTADENQHQRSTVWTGTLIADWQQGDFAFRSTTGYQSVDYFLHRDQDTSSVSIQTLDLTDQSLQVSQELLFHSTWDRPVQWTVGANYQYDKTPKTQLYIPNAQNTAASRGLLLQPFLLINALPPFIPEDIEVSLVDGCDPRSGDGCPLPKPVGETQADFIDASTSVENHVAGVFGLLAWDVIDRLTLSGGGRYSYTYRKWNDDSVTQSFVPLFLPPFIFNGDGLLLEQFGFHQTNDWDAFTWKVGADYQLAESHFLWATVSTGERAGGFNFSEEQPFKSEKILAVEAGSKSRFFDDRLQLNLTGFWYDWEDPQFTQRVDGINTVRNAPSAKSFGVEAELDALVTDALRLRVTFGWLEAFYDESFLSDDSTDIVGVDAAGLPEPNEVDLDGNRVPRSPRFTVSVGAEYHVDLGRWGRLVPRFDFYYRDAITFRQYDNPKDVQGRFTRTDVRIRWEEHRGRLWAEIFGRNLENKDVKTNQEIQNAINRVHYYDPPIAGGFRVGVFF